MFAGTGSCDVGTATEKLFLAVIGAVTGDTAQTDSLVLTATDQFSGSICSPFFEKSFGIAGSTVWLFVTGILWERMIGKQALIPILKGDV